MVKQLSKLFLFLSFLLVYSMISIDANAASGYQAVLETDSETIGVLVYFDDSFDLYAPMATALLDSYLPTLLSNYNIQLLSKQAMTANQVIGVASDVIQRGAWGGGRGWDTCYALIVYLSPLNVSTPTGNGQIQTLNISVWELGFMVGDLLIPYEYRGNLNVNMDWLQQYGSTIGGLGNGGQSSTGGPSGGQSSCGDCTCAEYARTHPRECGATGGLNFRIIWHDNNDVDLMVDYIGDTGRERISYSNRQGSITGGRLDIDANASCSGQTTSPVENIYFTNPPPGNYKVYVCGFQHCSNAPASTRVTVQMLMNGQVVAQRDVVVSKWDGSCQQVWGDFIVQ
jgi:hypothetical protein